MSDYKVLYAIEADDEPWLVVNRDRWNTAMLGRGIRMCMGNYSESNYDAQF